MLASLGLLTHTATRYRPVETVVSGVTKLSYPSTAASTGLPCHIQHLGAPEGPVSYAYERDGDWQGFFLQGADIEVGDELEATAGAYSGIRWYVRDVAIVDRDPVEHRWALLDLKEES